MRNASPFLPDDLADLDRLLSAASAVVAMEDVHEGCASDAIGLRHDVDNVIEPAVAMAEWEAERGYRSTYFILDGNRQPGHYWHDKTLLRSSLERIADCGHEIGYHCNAIARAIVEQRDPVELVGETLEELRGYGFHVHGVVAHGDPLCRRHGFVNDEMFSESARPSYGAPDRVVGGVQLEPVSRGWFGLDYDPNWLPRAEYLSDSGGRWSRPFDTFAAGFPYQGQTHLLVHADWWSEAFQAVPA
jgi:hypothetical protein